MLSADDTPLVQKLELVPETSAAERAVADLLPIGAERGIAERARDGVPVWFHTFALAPGIYTPGPGARSPLPPAGARGRALRRAQCP